jgi:hypothetical protein
MQGKNSNLLGICRTGPSIPALGFADDCIIFSSTEEASIQYIKSTLDKFCNNSGQSINHHKSSLYFSPVTTKFQKRRCKLILGIRRNKFNKNPYLGLPLITGRTTRSLFDKINISMTSRVNAWYNRHLNYAGRCVLINSTQNSLPMYTMKAFKLPIMVSKDIVRTTSGNQIKIPIKEL